eukprot:TRINITY_DN10682_c0_g1_i1.p1 TRINITY_DN10682_c0_g1~~TRINITY_DN10682_c0_g1_i1.p1  ORF type:complete len:135 (+),score=26.43 TRINITY_DN10682_c0_g1_i1:404-808(+)
MFFNWIGWLFLVILSAFLMIGTVFFVGEFFDLEHDFVNPVDLCKKLNPLVPANYYVHLSLAFFFIMNKSHLGMAVTLPIVIVATYRMYHGTHAFDSTEIFKTVGSHRKMYVGYLVSYTLSFFTSLYYLFQDLKH